jgi:hypothetical protein
VGRQGAFSAQSHATAESMARHVSQIDEVKGLPLHGVGQGRKPCQSKFGVLLPAP